MDPRGAAGDRREHDFRRRYREVLAMMLPDPEDIDAHLIRENALRHHLPQRLRLRQRPPGGVEGDVAERIESQLDHCAEAVSALSMAAFSSGDSGVTLLGKKATILPSFPMTYLLKFHAGRLPELPRNE